MFTGLKLLNHGLHRLYDTGECIVVQPPNASGNAHNSSDNTAYVQFVENVIRNLYLVPQLMVSVFSAEEGLEMQILRLDPAAIPSDDDNESITSLEYHKPNNSTIGNNLVNMAIDGNF